MWKNERLQNRHNLLQNRFRRAFEAACKPPEINPQTDAIVVLGHGTLTTLESGDVVSENKFRVDRAIEVARLVTVAALGKQEHYFPDMAKAPPLILVGSEKEHTQQLTTLGNAHYAGKVVCLESTINGENTTKTNILTIAKRFPDIRHVTIVTSAKHAVRADETASQHLIHTDHSVVSAHVPGLRVVPEVRREVVKLEEYARNHDVTIQFENSREETTQAKQWI